MMEDNQYWNPITNKKVSAADIEKDFGIGVLQICNAYVGDNEPYSRDLIKLMHLINQGKIDTKQVDVDVENDKNPLDRYGDQNKKDAQASIKEKSAPKKQNKNNVDKKSRSKPAESSKPKKKFYTGFENGSIQQEKFLQKVSGSEIKVLIWLNACIVRRPNPNDIYNIYTNYYVKRRVLATTQPYEVIADGAGISRRQVYRAIKSLLGKGYIRVEPVESRKPSSKKSPQNVYILGWIDENGEHRYFE